jgi:transposase InsO family protein
METTTAARSNRDVAAVSVSAAAAARPAGLAKPDPQIASGDPRSRRRQRAQQPRRVAESEARRRAGDYARQARQRGQSATVAARQLRVSPRTVRRWAKGAAATPVLRGRPWKTCSAAARQPVLRFLREVTGPVVGLEALRVLFPQLPRCVLADLLRRYRRVWRRRYRRRGFRLSWQQPGRVWAIDFSQAPQPIDGVLPYVFAVRDLASHQQLAWHPVRNETAREAGIVLQELFDQHGPPLVLKSDNGSAFIAAEFRQDVARGQALQLYSPPYHPQYNGALERSNATLKTYTQQQAVHEGHPFRWTSADLEQARQLANTITRPWGHRGPTPAEAWQARTPIGPEERRAFLTSAAAERSVARRALGVDEPQELSRDDQARVDRLALPRSLEALGYLTKTRVDRAPRKPKRLTRAELARRAAEQRTARETDSTQPPDAQRLATKTSEPPLAKRTARATMRTLAGADVVSSEIAPAPPPSRGERANVPWFRRAVALLLSLAKTAMITR